MTNSALAGLITPLFSVALAKKTDRQTDRGAVRALNKGPAQQANASRCIPNKLCFLGSGSGDDLPVTVATLAVNIKRPLTHPSPSLPLHPSPHPTPPTPPSPPTPAHAPTHAVLSAARSWIPHQLHNSSSSLSGHSSTVRPGGVLAV